MKDYKNCIQIEKKSSKENFFWKRSIRYGLKIFRNPASVRFKKKLKKAQQYYTNKNKLKVRNYIEV